MYIYCIIFSYFIIKLTYFTLSWKKETGKQFLLLKKEYYFNLYYVEIKASFFSNFYFADGIQ